MIFPAFSAKINAPGKRVKRPLDVCTEANKECCIHSIPHHIGGEGSRK